MTSKEDSNTLSINRIALHTAGKKTLIHLPSSYIMKSYSTSALSLLAASAASAFAPSTYKPHSTTSLNFFGGRKTVAASPLATEAIEIYQAKYSGTGEGTKFFFSSWGTSERNDQAPYELLSSLIVKLIPYVVISHRYAGILQGSREQ